MTNEIARPNEAEDQDSRLSAAEALYFHNIGILHDSILTGTGLWVGDADHILELIAKELPEYGGPDDDESFVSWALEISRPTIEKFRFFYQLQDKHHGSVSAGVWSILKCNADLSHYDSINATADDLADLAWQWIFFHLEELSKPGTASLGTRLYAVARFTALTWRKQQLRKRERNADVDVELIGKKADGDYFVDEQDDQSEFGGDGVPDSLNSVFDTESDLLCRE